MSIWGFWVLIYWLNILSFYVYFKSSYISIIAACTSLNACFESFVRQRSFAVLQMHNWDTERLTTLSKSKQESYLRGELNQRGCFHYASGNEQPDHKTAARLLVFFYICCFNFQQGGLFPSFLYYSKLSCFTSLILSTVEWLIHPEQTEQNRVKTLTDRTETRISEYKTWRTTQQTSHYNAERYMHS